MSVNKGGGQANFSKPLLPWGRFNVDHRTGTSSSQVLLCVWGWAALVVGAGLRGDEALQCSISHLLTNSFQCLGQPTPFIIISITLLYNVNVLLYIVYYLINFCLLLLYYTFTLLLLS